jgi:redox-sensitive bicupin YhaK (pirin superfamily)
MGKSRALLSRHVGRPHGPIRRFISPDDPLADRLKPFVFLDHLAGAIPEGFGFGFHPHSGIATLTYQLDADVSYQDTGGQNGRLRARGLEWMQAGSGAWHRGTIHPLAPEITGFQLWVALPPEQVPKIGNTTVLLGRVDQAVNPLPAPHPMTYLDVALQDGEVWRHTPPDDHDVAWLFPYRGKVRVGAEELKDMLGVLDDGPGPIEIEAQGPTRLLVGTALRHEWPLVLGASSVHSSDARLQIGLAGINRIAEQLRRDGLIG